MANACPACGKPALPAWKKVLIGPNTRIPCRSCGATLAIAAAELLWILPLALGVAASFAAPDGTVKAVLWGLGLVIGSMAKAWLVPMRRA